MRTEPERPSPFHAGERAVQERVGVRADIEPWARRVVRPFLPQQHRDFYGALPFIVAAARDAQGRPWATLLAGSIHSPHDRRLDLDARPVPGDALEGVLTPGADLGLLGIDLETRRRNRVNGRLRASDQGLSIDVDQTFGNCPQHITGRAWRRVTPPRIPVPARSSAGLGPRQREWIESADTLFIASGHRSEGDDPNFGMDASHRGGPPGFVEVADERTLVIPDYAGNNHFNTVGNLVMDPRAGVSFVDFTTGGMLQLTGHVEIDWDSQQLARFPGARRLLRLTIDRVIELPMALPLRWDDTGGSIRSLRLVDKIPQSADVTSFVFEARDGGPLPRFDAGQHLPIELSTGSGGTLRRSYSLSSAPDDPRYRISVKRQPHGLASGHLHDVLEPGAVLSTRNPAGDFVLEHGEDPVVLVSAGIGVTPMVSMLHALVDAPMPRPVWFVHGARDGAHHPLASEVRDLATRSDAVRLHVSYSRPAPGDRVGQGFDAVGRIDAERLASLVPGLEGDFYLCGPTSFMTQLRAELEARGVEPGRIHTESFGSNG